MVKIQAGDTVKHITRLNLSGGLAFNVLSVDGENALCAFFDTDKDQTMKEEILNVSDLILVHSVDGGFTD